jgi:hypothetical protein
MKDDTVALHRLDVDGAAIEFSDRGDGEPVLLVHAGVFAAWFPVLAEDPSMSGLRLITPVRVGYDSTRPAPEHHLTIADPGTAPRCSTASGSGRRISSDTRPAP